MSLPPLQTIRVFEAVARHGNLSRAATELNMTQSAVSYQIKQLETFAGSPLFNRLARGVELTARGQLIAPAVSRSLADLRAAFKLLRDDNDSVLVISTMQTIAGNWLAPRIGGFHIAHPETAVRIDVSNALTSFAGEGVDVAIRSGKGSWPGLACHNLFGQEFIPVASPAYLTREGTPAAPADMLRHVLIAPSDHWWDIWFRSAGVATPVTIVRPGIDVGTQQMAGSLAMAGHGIALVTPRFEASGLATGQLVPLFDIEATSGLNYYLVYAADVAHRRKIRIFRDWVLQEAGKD